MSNLYGQDQVTINGKVTDENQVPIPYVNVLVKGVSGMGTVTDFDGNFTLNVPSSESVLVFSFVGFQTIERRVGTNTSFTIQSELLNNAFQIDCGISSLNGKHPIDEVLYYSENTLANIFGSNEVYIYFGDFNREESQQGTHHSIMDLWESGEFSRLYSQFITESEDNSDYQLMDITSDDIFIYSYRWFCL